jgi:PleD family two-component response regulator
MTNHNAFGKEVATLDVAIVDDKRGMATILRSLFAGFGVGRIRVCSDPEKALDILQSEPPDLILTRDGTKPVGGCDFIRLIRQEYTEPLCFAAAMILSSHTKQRLVASALRAGAHQVVCLPVSATMLYRRIKWQTMDTRRFELRGSHYEVSGIDTLLERCVTQSLSRRLTPGPVTNVIRRRLPEQARPPAWNFASASRALTPDRAPPAPLEVWEL